MILPDPGPRRTGLVALAPSDILDLHGMKIAWALIRICANEPRFVAYLPHEQAEVIDFFEYVDHEVTGEDVVRARALLGEAA